MINEIIPEMVLIRKSGYDDDQKRLKAFWGFISKLCLYARPDTSSIALKTVDLLSAAEALIAESEAFNAHTQIIVTDGE